MSVMETTTNFIGSYAPDFELPGTDGEVHHLSDYLQKFRAVAVVFMCNHCPYVRLYLERIKQIQAQFQEQGFILIGINSNDSYQYPEDSFEKMKDFAAQQKLNFPYLRDSAQDVAYSFGAKTTPEVFLIDHDGIIRYRGRIDDNAEEPQAVQRPELKEAIAHLLSKQPISPELTEALGCSIKWRK